MKTIQKSMKSIIAVAIIASVSILNSCRKADDPTPAASTQQDQSATGARNINAMVFAPNAHMYGKSYSEWAAELFKWQFQFDCDHSPYLDETGAFQDQNQSGHVFFLGGARYGLIVDRSVTVPSGKSLFIPLVYYFANTGCGETESMLAGDVNGVVPAMDQLSATIDGDAVSNLSSYQTISGMFDYVGDPCWNSRFCIDGTQQKAIIGGYWLMLKPLSPGMHTIHTTGGASSLLPVIKDVTWHINQL